jgi:hypothetical protein
LLQKRSSKQQIRLRRKLKRLNVPYKLLLVVSNLLRRGSTRQLRRPKSELPDWPSRPKRRPKKKQSKLRN